MIHRFRVRNFKSIVDVDVESSPVTVLVGRSGTGKLNFVHAPRVPRDVLIAKQHLQQVWPEVRPMTAAPRRPTSGVAVTSMRRPDAMSEANGHMYSSAAAKRPLMIAINLRP